MKKTSYNASRKEIRTLINKLFKIARAESNSGEVDYDDETIQSLDCLLDVRDTWRIITTTIHAKSIDRTGSMFGGFPYTSKRFPWPRNNKGQALCPLVQINLDTVKDVTSQYFGTGLLQVWLDITSIDLPDVLRIIPRAEYNRIQPDTAYLDYLSHGDGDIDPWGWEPCSKKIGWKYQGKVCCDWDPYDRFLVSRTKKSDDLSDTEEEIVQKLHEYAEENGPSSARGNWLLGHPKAYEIGAIIDFYQGGNNNFITIGGPSFPPSEAECTANIFYEKRGRNVIYWFYWGRG